MFQVLCSYRITEEMWSCGHLWFLFWGKKFVGGLGRSTKTLCEKEKAEAGGREQPEHDEITVRA